MQLTAIVLPPLISFAILAHAVPQPPRPDHSGMYLSASESDLGAFQSCQSGSIGFHSCASDSPRTGLQPNLMNLHDQPPHRISELRFIESDGEDHPTSAHRPASPSVDNPAAQRRPSAPNPLPGGPAAEKRPDSPRLLSGNLAVQRLPPSLSPSSGGAAVQRHPDSGVAENTPQQPPELQRSKSSDKKLSSPFEKKPSRSQSWDSKLRNFKSSRKRPPRQSPFERRAKVLSVSNDRAVRSIWRE